MSVEMVNDIQEIARREHRSQANVMRALVLLGLRVYLNLSADIDEEASIAHLADDIRNAARRPEEPPEFGGVYACGRCGEQAECVSNTTLFLHCWSCGAEGPLPSTEDLKR